MLISNSQNKHILA